MGASGERVANKNTGLPGGIYPSRSKGFSITGSSYLPRGTAFFLSGVVSEPALICFMTPIYRGRNKTAIREIVVYHGKSSNAFVASASNPHK